MSHCEIQAALSAARMPPPVSVEAIEAQRAQWIWRAIRLVRERRKTSIALGLAIFVFLALKTDPVALGFAQSSGAASCGLSFWPLLISMLAGMALIGFAVENPVLSSPEPMEKKHCPEMARLLGALPNGRDFREAVIAQGRFFTERELIWARKAKKRLPAIKREEGEAKACRELYGVKSGSCAEFQTASRAEKGEKNERK